MRRTYAVLAIVAVIGAGPAARAQAPAPSPSAPSDAVRENRLRECTAQAERDRMSGGYRDTFITECMAGERFNPPQGGKPQP